MSDPESAKVVKNNKVVASSAIEYEETPEKAKAEHKFVETLHFNYDDGKTIRTVYDESEKEVVKQMALGIS